MEEDESFDEFYANLKDIVNSAFNLGKTIPKPKIVRKVFRSLPERFHAKITAIEESKDIDKIALIGWQSANLWVRLDKDREIKQEQKLGIEG